MLKDRVALISGASRGLGWEVARLLAQRGVRLILTARGAEALAHAADALPVRDGAVALPGDVADRRHVERLVALGLQRFGRIDILVNNASILGPTPMPPLEALPIEAFDEVLRVNAAAPLHLMQLVLPQMKARGEGIIVNLTSDAAVQAYAGWGGYGAGKAALEHLSRIAARELAGTGVRIYVVDPGDMNTQMHRDASPGVDLSGLPGPGEPAARLVDLIERETGPFGRFELQTWALGPARVMTTAGGA